MTTVEAALAGWALLVLLIAAIAALATRRAHDHGQRDEENTHDS